MPPGYDPPDPRRKPRKHPEATVFLDRRRMVGHPGAQRIDLGAEPLRFAASGPNRGQRGPHVHERAQHGEANAGSDRLLGIRGEQVDEQAAHQTDEREKELEPQPPTASTTVFPHRIRLSGSRLAPPSRPLGASRPRTNFPRHSSAGGHHRTTALRAALSARWRQTPPRERLVSPASTSLSALGPIHPRTRGRPRVGGPTVKPSGFCETRADPPESDPRRAPRKSGDPRPRARPNWFRT